MISESAIVCGDKPDDPTIVVLGEINPELRKKDAVSLKWRNCVGNAGETFTNFLFSRQKPGSTAAEQIAARDASEGSFTMLAPFDNGQKYDARADEELRIFNVQRNEEYVYTLGIFYKTDAVPFAEESFQVTVIVKG